MVYTKRGVWNKADVPTPLSTPTLRELPSRESCSTTTWSAAWSSRIEARAARIAALDSAFTVDPTVEEIIYSDNGEGKYDDTSNEGNKGKDREDDRIDAIGSNEGSEVDEDEDYVVAEDTDDDEDDNNNFYKSSLFDNDDDDSIDDTKYHVPLVRGVGVGCKPKSGRLDKPNTDGMS